jgi:hypothetical protein
MIATAGTTDDRDRIAATASAAAVSPGDAASTGADADDAAVTAPAGGSIERVDI